MLEIQIQILIILSIIKLSKEIIIDIIKIILTLMKLYIYRHEKKINKNVDKTK